MHARKPTAAEANLSQEPLHPDEHPAQPDDPDSPADIYALQGDESDLDAPPAPAEPAGAPLPFELPPVPEKPPHVCPSCDYNLTGLTSRRCPECGDHFTLEDARYAGGGGRGGSVEQASRQRMLTLRRRYHTGLALIAIGLIGPWATRGFDHKAPLMILLLVAAPIILPSIYYTMNSEVEWATLVLFWGIMTVIVGAWFML